MKTKSTELAGLQMLRAVAALAVVAYHATLYASQHLSGGIELWQQGAAGVDIFFVLSGFVMFHSIDRRREVGSGSFLQARLTRIVPMYWLATLLKVAAVLFVPAMALHADITARHTVLSLLFIPVRDSGGVLTPVLPVGWTLNFEMFFYLLIALALRFRRSPRGLVCGVLVALAGLSVLRRDDSVAPLALVDPMLLEFAAGALIQRAASRGQLHATACGVLALLGAVALCLSPGTIEESSWRAIVWGVPAALIVAGVVANEHLLLRTLPRRLVDIGDASYSIYLFHPFIVPVLGAIVLRTSSTYPVALLVASSLLASSIAGLLLYRFIEAPMTRLLRRFQRPRHASLHDGSANLGASHIKPAPRGRTLNPSADTSP